MKYLDRHVSSWLTQIHPKLDYKQYKGSNGKIGVIGGSIEYTGAPYFSAISAQFVGADLSYIFCHEDAATAIKSYHPDIIVQPSLPITEDNFQTLSDNIKHLNSVVIGPGLGKSENILDNFEKLIGLCKNKNLIADADFFWYFLKCEQKE